MRGREGGRESEREGGRERVRERGGKRCVRERGKVRGSEKGEGRSTREREKGVCVREKKVRRNKKIFVTIKIAILTLFKRNKEL